MLIQPPKSRADCTLRGTEICPWIRCKYHAIWWHPNIIEKWTPEKIFNWIDSLPLHFDCLLDAIDHYGTITQGDIAQIFGTTVQHISMIELKAKRKLKRIISNNGGGDLDDMADSDFLVRSFCRGHYSNSYVGS